MAVTQVRHFRSLPEVRRVIKKLTVTQASDQRNLANLQRAFYNLGLAVIAANEDDAPPASKRSGFIVRDNTPGRKVEPEREAEQIDDKKLRLVNQISHLVGKSQERKDVAKHIRSLLTHTFNSDEDNTAARMLKLVEGLIKTSDEEINKANEQLGAITKATLPNNFMALTKYVHSALRKKFDGKYKSIEHQTSMATAEYKNANSVFFVSYHMFRDLQGVSSTQDYIIVLTRVEPFGKPKNQVRHFLRTLTSYKPPTWVAEHPLGVELPFDYNESVNTSTVETVMQYVLHNMYADQQVHAIEPVPVPLKSSELNFSSDYIDKTVLNEEKGQIWVYLKKDVTPKQVEEAQVDTMGELRDILRVQHPRYRNSLQAFKPQEIAVKVRDSKGKETQSLRVVLKFAFSRSDNMELELPTDKVRKVGQILDIDNQDTLRKITRSIRDALGLQTTIEDNVKREAKKALAPSPATAPVADPNTKTEGQKARDALMEEKRKKEEDRIKAQRAKGNKPEADEEAEETPAAKPEPKAEGPKQLGGKKAAIEDDNEETEEQDGGKPAAPAKSAGRQPLTMLRQDNGNKPASKQEGPKQLGGKKSAVDDDDDLPTPDDEEAPKAGKTDKKAAAGKPAAKPAGKSGVMAPPKGTRAPLTLKR